MRFPPPHGRGGPGASWARPPPRLGQSRREGGAGPARPDKPQPALAVVRSWRGAPATMRTWVPRGREASIRRSSAPPLVG
eukprot:12840067-Alexandrium_andersonii.AAC.1